MGFFDSLASSAGDTLGSNLFGGKKEKVIIENKENKEKKAGFFSSALEDERESEKAERESKEFRKARFMTINEIQFSSDVDEISNALSKLIGYLHQLDEEIDSESMFNKNQLIKELKPTKELIFEKIEFGMLKLNKLDKDIADFFQKKIDSINAPAEQQ